MANETSAPLTLHPARVGCSGWQYKSWRGEVYPPGCAQSRWLKRYSEMFDTVEVNSTFYRLASPPAVAAWLEQTPPDFLFALKASRYLTHMKRLADMRDGIGRFYEGIAPLAESRKMGPVLWQLSERFVRDDERLAQAIDELPAGRHCFELRHPSWFHPDVYALLYARGVALAIGHHPARPWVEPVLTADWTLRRFHYGARGRRGNYSDSELIELAGRVNGLRERAEVLVYFNNDWEAFAPRNARRLRALLAP